MLQGARTVFNPNFTRFVLFGIGNNVAPRKTWQKSIQHCVNLSQFVISTYAISNKYLPNHRTGYVLKPSTFTGNSNGLPGNELNNVQEKDGHKATWYKRSAHVATIAVLYILHQYSKNTVYGLIALMVFTKIVSNLNAYIHRSDNMVYETFKR